MELAALPRSVRAEPVLADTLRKMARAAVHAPSPDNNQPWRIATQGRRLRLGHDEARALPSDAAGLFSLLALGAATENAALAARADGWTPRVRLAPAEITVALSPGGAPDPLHDRIETRCTNRRPYRREPVPADTLAALEAAADATVDWVTDRTEIGRIADLVAAADRVRFERRAFHEELHRQLRLTVPEAEATRDGLDVRTLEVPPGAAALLRWLRPWRRARAVNRLGLSRLMTIPSARLVRASGALGLLTIDALERDACFAAGRALQRVWLAADARDLALHPLGSLPIFLAHVSSGGEGGLSSSQATHVRRLGERLERVVPALRGRTLAMLFRLGRAPAPRVRSLRRPLEDVLDTEGGA